MHSLMDWLRYSIHYALWFANLRYCMIKDVHINDPGPPFQRGRNLAWYLRKWRVITRAIAGLSQSSFESF